jgi:hypothetical protein
LLTAPPTPSAYVLGRLLRAIEKYITAKAASNTPPTIKIEVVTIGQSHPLDLIMSVIVATGTRDDPTSGMGRLAYWRPAVSRAQARDVLALFTQAQKIDDYHLHLEISQVRGRHTFWIIQTLMCRSQKMS